MQQEEEGRGLKRKEHKEVLPTTKKRKTSDLNKLTKSEVYELLKTEIPLDDDDLSKIGNLKGLHLSSAINDYNINIKSNGTLETAKIRMLETLKRSNIADDNVAAFIADWLINNFIIVEYSVLDDTSIITVDSIIEFIKNQINISTDKSIEEQIEKSSKIIVNSFGANFTFIGRKEPIEMIYNNFINYSTIRKQVESKLDKSFISLPFIAAAPGIGKSRLLKEMGKELYNATKSHCFPLYITWGNGCSLDDEGEYFSVEQSLVLRMIYSLLYSLSYNNFILFSLLKEAFFNFLRGKKDINLLQLTLKAFKQILVINECIEINTFYLAMDEVHEIDTVSKKEKELNPFRKLISLIGGYMQESYEINISPLFAGTYHQVIHENLAAYMPKFIPMKALLPENEIYSILDQLVTSNDNLLNWRTNCKFRHYLRTFGGFARGIEYYLQAYQGNNSTTLSAWMAAKNKLYEKYYSTSPINNNFLLYNILTRNQVEKSDIIPGMTKTFSDLENEGRIMLDSVKGKDVKFVATYPTVLLYYLIRKDLKEIFEELFFNTEKVCGGTTWEDIIHSYTFLNLNLLCGYENITFEQLFPFAEMTDKTKSIILDKIPQAKMVLYSDQKIEFATPSILNLKHKNEECTVRMLANNKADYNEKIVYVVKNGTSAQAGDVIFLGLKLNDSKSLLVFHIQCKWADAEKESLSMAEIDKQVEKNKKLIFQRKKKNEIFNCNTRNITVIITGKQVTNLALTDDLVVISKSNFASYFGIFANQMKFLHATNFLHINE